MKLKNWGASAASPFASLCLALIAHFASRQIAGVMCQAISGGGHFKPILHPYPLPSRMIYLQQQQQVAPRVTPRPAQVLTAPQQPNLGFRGQGFLNQMIQNHQQQQQRRQQHAYQPAVSQHVRQREPFISDRRASSGEGAAANQVPSASFANSKSQESNTHQQQQQQADRNNGKLLICYYTTKQTAPYWPKDAREFIVPADHLNQAAWTFATSESPAGRFSSPVSQLQQQQNKLLSTLDSKITESNNQQQERRHATASSGAGGGPPSPAPPRMVVVAPKFVPFNQTTMLTSYQSEMMAANNQHSSPTFAQMFFAPPNNNNNDNDRNTIANRQDNAALTSSQGATNLPQGTRQSQVAVPHMTELIVSNNDFHGNLNNNNNNNGPGIVFAKTFRSKHDLSNANRQRKLDGGGPASATIVNNEANKHDNLPQQQQQQVAPATISTPMLFAKQPHQQNNGAIARGQHHSSPESPANVNNRDQQLERSSQMKQQQLIYSPSMSRAFIVGASVGVPSQPPPIGVAGGSSNIIDNQDQLLGQTVPLVNADTSDYYYYYNQPSGNNVALGGSPPSNQMKTPGSSNNAAATTISLATNSYRPMQQPQRPQQHELSHGGLQKGKSLQMAESELSPALPTSSLAPIAFADSTTSLAGHSSPPAQTSYAIGGINPTTATIGHSPQSTTLDRLIVSSGPTSHAVSTALTPSDLLTMSSSGSSSGGDDGLIISGTKTTPIASSVSPSSPPSSSSSAVAASQQIHVATLPSGLMAAYSQSPASASSAAQAASIATAQPPNGSSTAAAFASLPTANLQMSSDGGGSSMPSFSGAGVNAASLESTNANNRLSHNQHQHSVNKQIVGVGGNSLSAALVSSPLSTMFDVFGAASQYLMRFKPSSLISPSSFASLSNSIVGDSSHNNNNHHSFRSNSSSLVSSLPFASGILGSSSSSSYSPSLHHKSNNYTSGFLSRLSLQSHQRREDICGRTIQTPERRIIGGEGARYGEFPYQVHIKIAKHQCGGALIDKQSIVTAAHCVYHFITRAPVSKLQIVIGAYDIEDEQYQELPPQYFKVNRVKLHPNFRFSASHPDRYDIAILKLDKPVKYTDNVLPVCLPAKDLKYESMVGTVTGFGKTDPSLSNRYGTRLLQKVDVPIIENSECERWHRTRGIDLKIFPEMMCAGYEDGLKDACVGDSGGPLVVKTPVGSNGSFRWTLAGITSAGFGCAQSRQPGIYHRVSHTVDWILDNLD